MPPMNAHGTNTAASTSPTAITGPETASIALIVASRGGSPSSIVVLDGFHYDDRVVHDNADREYQSEQRQVVEREADGRHDRERPDDRHRHGDE